MGGGDDGKHRILNVNVGILGHIDSGKTSLGAWREVACFSATSNHCPRHAPNPHSAAKPQCAISSLHSLAARDLRPPAHPHRTLIAHQSSSRPSGGLRCLVFTEA